MLTEKHRDGDASVVTFTAAESRRWRRMFLLSRLSHLWRLTSSSPSVSLTWTAARAPAESVDALSSSLSSSLCLLHFLKFLLPLYYLPSRPSPPGQLDYTSALVRTSSLSLTFIERPSIRRPVHPPICHPFPPASLHPLRHKTPACLHISHPAPSIFYSSSVSAVTFSPPSSIFHTHVMQAVPHVCPMDPQPNLFTHVNAVYVDFAKLQALDLKESDIVASTWIYAQRR